MAMDIDLVVDSLDTGVQFLEFEEEQAHLELDQIMVRLDVTEKEDRKQGSLILIGIIKRKLAEALLG